MFGAVPGVYRNVSAVFKVARAYNTTEEGVEWVVVIKDCDGIDWYNVCRVSDLDQAANEGYVKYEKE